MQIQVKKIFCIKYNYIIIATKKVKESDIWQTCDNYLNKVIIVSIIRIQC